MMRLHGEDVQAPMRSLAGQAVKWASSFDRAPAAWPRTRLSPAIEGPDREVQMALKSD
jgi:hypothetical protein